MLLKTPVSVGEVFDKITILEIKRECIKSQAKLVHVNNELERLISLIKGNIENNDTLNKLVDELKTINKKLWNIEDEIRICEKNSNFGNEFVQLARDVYFTNDRRAAIKFKINDLMGSTLVEVKSYEEYKVE